jgi:GINS complex subunit 4
MGDELGGLLEEQLGRSDVRAAGSEVNPKIEELLRAWCNEKASPELLPYQGELVDSFMGVVREQQKALGGEKVDVFTAGLYQLDIDRVKFVLASYLRARLAKVQRWYLHLQGAPEVRERLSPAEREFLREFTAARSRHLDATVLHQLPAGLRTLDGGGVGEGGGGGGGGGAPSLGVAESTLRDGPSQQTHVFVRALQDLGNPAWGGNNEVRAGNGYIVAYSAVVDDLLAGRVELR